MFIVELSDSAKTSQDVSAVRRLLFFSLAKIDIFSIKNAILMDFKRIVYFCIKLMGFEILNYG